MRDKITPFISLALNKTSVGEEHDILRRRGLPFKQVDGVYKGLSERSIE